MKDLTVSSVGLILMNRISILNKAMNEIHRQIKKSVETLTKEKSLMDDVKWLLKTAFKFSNNGTISNFKNNFARHILPTI